MLAPVHKVRHLLEGWAVPLVSAAAAVHILRCLPPLMLPSGVLGALVLLVAGAAGGILALAAGAARALLGALKECLWHSRSTAPALLSPHGGAP